MSNDVYEVTSDRLMILTLCVLLLGFVFGMASGYQFKKTKTIVKQPTEIQCTCSERMDRITNAIDRNCGPKEGQ